MKPLLTTLKENSLKRKMTLNKLQLPPMTCSKLAILHLPTNLIYFIQIKQKYWQTASCPDSYPDH